MYKWTVAIEIDKIVAIINKDIFYLHFLVYNSITKCPTQQCSLVYTELSCMLEGRYVLQGVNFEKWAPNPINRRSIINFEIGFKLSNNSDDLLFISLFCNHIPFYRICYLLLMIKIITFQAVNQISMFTNNAHSVCIPKFINKKPKHLRLF